MKNIERSADSTPIAPASDIVGAIAEHWSKRCDHTDSTGRVLRTRWWQHPPIIRHINRNVCDEATDGLSAGLTMRARRLLGGRLPLAKGISVGCGNGFKEMNLLKQAIVESFDLYELAETRIAAGREAAQQRGLTGAGSLGGAHFIQGDAFRMANKSDAYDLVHWNNSLHHMLNVEAAIEWSWKVLKPGGLFYMDDFVGPDRFPMDTANAARGNCGAPVASRPIANKSGKSNYKARSDRKKAGSR